MVFIKLFVLFCLIRATCALVPPFQRLCASFLVHTDVTKPFVLQGAFENFQNLTWPQIVKNRGLISLGGGDLFYIERLRD